MATYLNLRLILEKVPENTYRAQLEHEREADPSSVKFAFAPDTVVAEGKNFRYYFDRINALTVKADELRIVGRALYDLVFQGVLKGKFQAWFETLDPDKKIRLRLDIRAPELMIVPWELFCDDKWFLARRGISIVRFTGNARKNDVQLGPNLKVLIVSAAPGGQLTFDEDKYVLPVKALFEQYGIAPDLLTGTSTTYDGLLEQLTDHKYDLFHFIGHGLYQGGTGKIYLLDSQRRPEALEGGDLGTLLRDSQVKFVFLCSCQTGQTGPGNPFWGVAQSLVGADIPAVVAMQYNFPQNEDARTFVEGFYKRLVGKANIDEAMQYARGRALRSNEVAWCIPVLYSQFDVGTLVAEPLKPRDQPASAPVAAPPPSTVLENPFVEFGKPAPPERFCSQVHVLNDLIDALLQRRNTLLVGERRMGKTSLLQYLTYDKTMRAHGLDPATHLHVFYDVSALSELSFSAFWRDLLLRVGRQLPNAPEGHDLKTRIDTLCSGSKLNDLSVRRVVVDLRHQYELTFFVDEFDAILRPEFDADFFDFLCTVNETYGAKFIASTRYRPPHYLRQGLAHAQRFFESCLVLDLHPFNERDCDEFFIRHALPNGPVFTTDDRRLLKRLSGYYPYYLRVGCSVLFDVRAQQLSEREGQTTMLTQFWQQAAGSLADHWSNSDEQEKLMLIVLALRGQGRGEGPRIAREVLVHWCPNWQATCEGLRQRGLVLEENGRVALFCRSLEAWILDTLKAQDGSTDAGGVYADWYHDFYGRALAEDCPHVTQRMCTVFSRVHKAHWDLLSRWCRQAKYQDAALSLLAMLPRQFSPQDYLRDS